MCAKPKETNGSGASIGFREVKGISVIVEDHVTRKEFDDAVGMSGCIVEQVNAGMGGGFSGAGLLQSTGAKGHEHGVVDGADIVEEHTHNFSDASGGGRIQRRRGVNTCHLNFGSMLGRHMFVGAVRGGWISVAKTFEGLGNIARHGEFDRVFDVVPLKMESTELCPGPIDDDGVVLVEGGDEKVGSGLANILDAKAIDNESKHDWFGGVDTESGVWWASAKRAGVSLRTSCWLARREAWGRPCILPSIWMQTKPLRAREVRSHWSMMHWGKVEGGL